MSRFAQILESCRNESDGSVVGVFALIRRYPPVSSLVTIGTTDKGGCTQMKALNRRSLGDNLLFPPRHLPDRFQVGVISQFIVLCHQTRAERSRGRGNDSVGRIGVGKLRQPY
jgi:hypothetical protein